MTRLLAFSYQLIRLVIIVFDALLVVGIVFSIKKGWAYRPHFGAHEGSHGGHDDGHAAAGKADKKAKAEAQWSDIVKKINEETPDSRKIAIIAADKLVDTILREAGLAGETMADRLNKLSPKEFPSLQALWQAHRLRNEIVHSPDFDLSDAMAKKTLRDYQAFLIELGLLQ